MITPCWGMEDLLALWIALGVLRKKPRNRSGELTTQTHGGTLERVSMAMLNQTSLAGARDTVLKTKPSCNSYKGDGEEKPKQVSFSKVRVLLVKI